MENETQERIVRALFDEWNSGSETSEVYERAFAPGFVCHGPPEITHSHEPGDENCAFHIFKQCFEGLRFDLARCSADGDRVVADFTVRGRQVAEFRRVRPRAEEQTFTGLMAFRIAEGQIVEGWGLVNWAFGTRG